MKPKKQCNHVGCIQLVDYDVKHCQKHENKGAETYKDRKQADGKYLTFYNSKLWRKTSYLYRLNHPLCEDCLLDNVIIKADVVDHIIELKDDWSKRLDEDNLRSLCHSHHNKKTAKVRTARHLK